MPGTDLEKWNGEKFLKHADVLVNDILRPYLNNTDIAVLRLICKETRDKIHRPKFIPRWVGETWRSCYDALALYQYCNCIRKHTSIPRTELVEFVDLMSAVHAGHWSCFKIAEQKYIEHITRVEGCFSFYECECLHNLFVVSYAIQHRPKFDFIDNLLRSGYRAPTIISYAHGGIEYVRFAHEQLRVGIHRYDYTAVEIAAKLGDIAVLNYLYEHGARFAERAYNEALRSFQPLKILQWLHAHNEEPVEPGYNFNVCHLIKRGDIPALEYMVKTVSAILKEYDLMAAIISDQHEIVHFITKYVATVHWRNIMNLLKEKRLEYIPYLFEKLSANDKQLLIEYLEMQKSEFNDDAIDYMETIIQKHNPGYLTSIERYVLSWCKQNEERHTVAREYRTKLRSGSRKRDASEMNDGDNDSNNGDNDESESDDDVESKPILRRTKRIQTKSVKQSGKGVKK